MSNPTLKKSDLVLFSVAAILVLDPLVSTAAIGVSSLFWWIFMAFAFFLPFGLISAELGTSYPEQGGVYAWVRDAFGRTMGARVAWAYWVNVALWNPAQFILLSTIFTQLFVANMSLPTQVVLCIVLCWTTVFLNVISLDFGKWIPNLGAILKILIILALIFGGVAHYLNEGAANSIDMDALMPCFDASLKYVPVVIYGMLGFELMCAGARDIRNPQRDLPLAILWSGLIIAGLYALGTLGILIALPIEDLNLVEGLVATFHSMFGEHELGALVALVLGAGAIFTVFSGAVTWCLGTNRTMAETALEGGFPKWLAIEHPRFRTPAGAAVASGVLSTLVLAIYGSVASSNEELFWALFACSAVIFLLPYMVMMAAFVRLRIRDFDLPRPFKVPGGNLIASICAVWCFAVLAFSLILLVYVPELGLDLWVLFGSIAVLLIGEVAIRVSRRAEIRANER